MRESLVPPTNFYVSFREWIDKFYSNLTEEVWGQIIAEDENIDYSVTGSGMQYEEMGEEYDE